MIELDEIRGILPHRYPMLLVDRVGDVVRGERLTAFKAVTANEPWYGALGADGGVAPDYPAVLVIESWCQAAGVLAAWERRNPDVLAGQVMLFGSIADIVFHGRVVPGDVMEHQVRIVRELSDATVVDGRCLVGGETVMEVGRVVMALRQAEVLREAVG